MAYYNVSMRVPVAELIRRHDLSLRQAAERSGVSRGCLSQILAGEENLEVRSLAKLAGFLGQSVEILSYPEGEVLSECSTVAVAMAVQRDGFETWKTHFFNLVDEFRRTLDPRLIMLPAPRNFEPRLQALLASLVRDLTGEVGMSAPPWATKRYYLQQPWFVSEMESLRASALFESPLPYRNNNIFVHQNFLARA